MPLQVELAVSATTLVLVGGGEFSFGETRAIDEFIVSKIPQDRRVVAFLPTASGSPEYAQHFGKYLREIGPLLEVRNVPVYRGRDARRQKNLDLILSAGLIYLGGGVTNSLIETIRESAAEMAMRDAASNGAVIAAIGAAASSFGRHARDMRGGRASLPGLGWIANAAVDAGFDEKDETLRRLMSLPDVALGIGIPTRTALVIASDGSTQVLGDGKIAAFRKG